jgi:hypothetical protein
MGKALNSYNYKGCFRRMLQGGAGQVVYSQFVRDR